MKFATSKPKTNLKKRRNIYFAIFQEGLLRLQMNLVSRFGAKVSHFYRSDLAKDEYIEYCIPPIPQYKPYSWQIKNSSY